LESRNLAPRAPRRRRRLVSRISKPPVRTVSSAEGEEINRYRGRGREYGLAPHIPGCSLRATPSPTRLRRTRERAMASTQRGRRPRRSPPQPGDATVSPGSTGATRQSPLNAGLVRRLAAHRGQEHEHNSCEEQRGGDPNRSHRRAITEERLPSVKSAPHKGRHLPLVLSPQSQCH
jgi:hypothetical protein